MTAFINRLSTFMVNYFTLDDLVPQAEAEKTIRDGVSFRGTNILILIIAILIASLGLNTNSSAVIIGAMLISPLMGPIIGIGLGIGVHDFGLIKRCLRNLVMAAGFSIIASTIYFLISPVNEGHSELLARTSPTIYDVLIGFFGGGAGVIGLCSKNKGNVIPGVAIATALMPPLCTAGYGIATWQPQYFIGATYLFIINSIYIAVSTFIGIKLFKYKTAPTADNDRARRVMRIVYVVAILTMIPSIWLTYNMIRENKFNMNVTSFVNSECQFPATQVLKTTTSTIDGHHVIKLTLIGRVLPQDSLTMALSSKLHFYGLGGSRLEILQGDAMTTPEISSNASTSSEIFQLAQSTITRQQSLIDSLRHAALTESMARSAGVDISPELKVVFPEVEEIALTEPIFANVQTERLDTTHVALVRFSKPMSTSQRAKFKEYLEARLNVDSLRIVSVDL